MAYRAEIEIAVKGANQLSSFQGKLNASALAVDNLNKFLEAFSNKGEGISRSISNLNRQLQTAARNFNEVALGTDEAKTAAINYLNATRSLNEGLRERAALLAEVAENERKAKLAAAGIRETTQFSGPIGPGQATTFGTGQEFVGQSSPVAGRIQRALEGRKDELELKRALQALDQRSVSALEEKLNIQTKITNLVSLQAQRAKDAQLQGQSLRIPTPFRTAGSMGFPVALPEIEQDRKIRERAQAQESAKRALNLQKSNSLLTQGVTNLKLQVAVAQQLGGVYEEIVRSLKTANERQSKLFRARSNRQQRQELGQQNVEQVKRINQLAGNRVIQENLKNKAYQIGAKLRNNEFNEAKRLGVELDDLIKAEDARIDRARRVLKFRQKERAEIRATAKERGRRRRDAASNAIIGGAFPLLFGQGAGASVGGAVGGGLGGLAGGQFGFGLSLVGTAAGQAIDTLVAKAADLGKALDPVNGNVETIIKSLGLADSATGKYIKRLEEVAGKQAALEEATKQLALVVGDEGVEALRQFGESTKDLGNTISQFITQIAAEAAKLLQGPVEATSSIVGAVVTQRAALSSSDPRLASLQQEFRDNTGERTRAEITAELLETYRQITEEAENEAAARLAAATPANQLLATAERRYEIAKLNDDILNDQVFKLEEQQLAQDLIQRNLELRRKAEGDIVLQARLQKDLKASQVKFETDLLNLTRKRSTAEEKAKEKARRDAERAAREQKRLEDKAKRNRERLEREENQRQQAITRVSLFALDSSVRTAGIDKGPLGRIERELSLLQIKKGYQEDAIVLANEDSRIQKIRFSVLDQEVKNRERVLNLERERIKLSIEQEKIDADRARRSQIEGIRQESFGFTAQLADPFNLNPERVIAAEAELRTSQLLRAEREKLADLEREGAAISSFASAESVKKLAEQIDKQKAFIPQLEAELAVRNQLELAAARQSVIIEKYGFLANELSTAMSSAVQAVVTGTGTVEEAFSTMFANIGKAFIDMATQMLAQKLFMTVLGALGGGFNFSGGSASSGLSAANLMGGAGPLNAGMFGFGRASGGSVSPGSTYLVGERGPELLTMGPSGGYVTSNSASQAAMDRYSSGNSRGGSISVNYNVTDINGMRFVTEDQFREGVAQAAKQGADGGFNRTMSSLKNNRSTRSRIGV